MTVMDAPERTVEQRTHALELANRIRSYRAQYKKDLKDGTRTVGDARQEILTPGPLMESMKVREFLMALPKFGAVKSREVMRRCEISSAKTLVGMTGRQRDALWAALVWYDRGRGGS